MAPSRRRAGRIAVLAMLLKAAGRDLSGQQGASPPTAVAKGAIDGVVSDTGLRPLTAASVGILNTPVVIATSEGGRFRITDMAPGPYVVTVRKIGYQPIASIVHVAPGETARMSFSLERLAIGLDTVRITEKAQLSWQMRGFESRQKAGLGSYYTSTDIRKWGGNDLGNFVRRTLGVTVATDRVSGQSVLTTVRSYGCPMLMVVDEVPMPAGVPLDFLPNLKEIAAIEVYKNGNVVPARYAPGGAACGAVLIWTKTGY